ncbi:hypothetical protein Btru_014973 [Bulinus truncatus]|nr:hypothetical protein Btru_014973 [Bulinus truncatus]
MPPMESTILVLVATSPLHDTESDHPEIRSADPRPCFLFAPNPFDALGALILITFGSTFGACATKHVDGDQGGDGPGAQDPPQVRRQRLPLRHALPPPPPPRLQQPGPQEPEGLGADPDAALPALRPGAQPHQQERRDGGAAHPEPVVPGQPQQERQLQHGGGGDGGGSGGPQARQPVRAHVGRLSRLGECWVEDRWSTKIKDGLTNIKDGLTKIKDDLTKIKDGLTKIKDGLTKIKDGLTKIKDSLTKVASVIVRVT